MIKALEVTEETVVMSLLMQDGTEYKEKDIPSDPFIHAGLVAFWSKDTLISVPVGLVKEVRVHKKGDDQ